MSLLVKKIKIMDNSEMEQEDILLCNLVLQNELILANVFKYLKGAEMKILRKVSHQWNKVICPIMQNKTMVKLNENVHGAGSVLEEFLQVFATVPSSRIFFRNYRMSLWNLDEDTNAMIAFWEKFGPTMHFLELSWVRIVGVETVRDLFFKHTPNLRRLFVKDCSFYEAYDENRGALKAYLKPEEVNWNTKVNKNLTTFEFNGGEAHNNFPICWQEVFTGFPNLKHLEFYNITPKDTGVILEKVKSFKQKFPNGFRIEKLNIFNGDYAAGEIPQSILDQFLSLKLPLKELSIDIGSHCQDYAIAKVLEHHRHLRKLIIYRGPLGTPMESFPFKITFPNLRILEMTETVADNMNFFQYMPNLSSFSLCEPPEVEPPFLPSDLVMKTDIRFATNPLPLKLTHIRIDYDISCGDVRKLVYWFPHIIIARVYLDDEGFRTVCGEWSNLEELEVLGDKLTSAGVTGIKFLPNKGTGTSHKTYHPNNITCLTKLRKLLIKNYNLSTDIDDLSITEGFLKMKYLNHIELCSKHITEEGWEKLFNCSQIQTLIPSDGKWKSECEQYTKNNSSKLKA